MADQPEQTPDKPSAATSNPDAAAVVAESEPEAAVKPQDKELAPFGDIPLDLGVQLDHRQISVRELLSLDEGSLIRLGRSTGENVDLLLNGILAGGGEIVVIDDMVGLRITDIYTEGVRWEGPWRRRQL